MDNIDFQDFDFSSTNRSRIKTCSKCKSAEHTITKCPMNSCGYCKISGHISSSCLVKKQDIQARKRIRNMSPEQILRQQENHLAGNMRPFPVLRKVCSFWSFLGPQKCFASYIHQKCVPFGKKGTCTSFPKPPFPKPPWYLLGEVPFIVLRPVFIFCYFGGQFWKYFLNIQIVVKYLF